MHEASKYKDNCFMTLTYRDEDMPNVVFVRELQLFFKRMRKSGHVFKYYACGEYGEKSMRPHYHVAFLGYSPVGKPGYVDLPQWPYGQVHFGALTPDSAQYVAGYHLKKFIGKDTSNLPSSPFAIMSRRPGIGDVSRVRYKSVPGSEDVPFVWRKGCKVGLPRFYKVKLGIESEIPDEPSLLHKLWRLDNSDIKGLRGANPKKALDVRDNFMLNYKQSKKKGHL